MTGGVLCFSLSRLLRRRPILSSVFLAVALMFGGILAFQCRQYRDKDHVDRRAAMLYGRSIVFEGIVVSDVQKRSLGRGAKTSFVLTALRVRPIESLDWRPLNGRILVNIFQDKEIHYGDRLRLEGKLHRPFEFHSEGNFSYKQYLKNQGIAWILSVKKSGKAIVIASEQGAYIQAFCLAARDYFGKTMERFFNPTQAGIMNALVLGERSTLSKPVQELFVRTGTAHILAISGFNVGIVAFVFFLLWKLLRIKRGGQYALTILCLIFYCILTGGKPPVVRSTIMSLIWLCAFLLEKRHDSLNTLGFAAWLILLFQPLAIFDVGFQLSFVSVLFIILYYRKFFLAILGWFRVPRVDDEDHLLPMNWSDYPVRIFLAQSLALTLSAWLGVLALIAFYFEIITPITMVANLIIVPLVSILVALGVGLLLTSHLIPFLAHAFASCIELLLAAMIGITWILSKIPGAYFYLRHVGWNQVVIYYFILIPFLEGWRLLFLKQYLWSGKSFRKNSPTEISDEG